MYYRVKSLFVISRAFRCTHSKNQRKIKSIFGLCKTVELILYKLYEELKETDIQLVLFHDREKLILIFALCA